MKNKARIPRWVSSLLCFGGNDFLDRKNGEEALLGALHAFSPVRLECKVCRPLRAFAANAAGFTVGAGGIALISNLVFVEEILVSNENHLEQRRIIYLDVVDSQRLCGGEDDG